MSEVKSLGEPKHAVECFKGSYLSAENLRDEKWTLKIHAVENVMLPPLSGGPDVKQTVITFQMADGKLLDKKMICNTTNLKYLVEMFGQLIKNWKGKSITIYSEPGCFQGKDPGIRIYGSPDIPADMTVTIRLPRKKPTTKTLYKTGRKAEETNDGV